MLIKINTRVLAKALDLIFVQKFCLQMKALENIPLFLELIWAHISMLLIKENTSAKAPTQALDDIPLTAEANITKKWKFPLRMSSVNVTKSVGNYIFGHIHWRNA